MVKNGSARPNAGGVQHVVHLRRSGGRDGHHHSRPRHEPAQVRACVQGLGFREKQPCPPKQPCRPHRQPRGVDDGGGDGEAERQTLNPKL